jgi:hypothetical protein
MTAEPTDRRYSEIASALKNFFDYHAGVSA